MGNKKVNTFEHHAKIMSIFDSETGNESYSESDSENIHFHWS